MKKQAVKDILLRVIILMAGLTVAHLGVTLFILADLGTDPFNVLVQGIFRTLALPLLTHGRVHILICLLIIAVLLLTDRSYIRIGTLLCMAFGGPIIDGFTLLLTPLAAVSQHIVFRIVMNLLGCVILAYGMTIVIRSEAGTGPNDLVAVVISDKTKKKFSTVRIITDLAFVGIGWALGGSVGLGTVLCAFCVGPVAGFFLPLNKRLIDRILQSALGSAKN
ncbi:MAG: hypothetical protein IJ412_10935 [Oscillospiraceae bacterium]|nr:hypothetical protein [Oscillospiraceae bacterium]